MRIGFTHSLASFFRTDAHVHALRNAIICQVPLERATLDETPETRKGTIASLNKRIQKAHGEGLTVLDVQKVSAGFCIRRSVEYRCVVCSGAKTIRIG